MLRAQIYLIVILFDKRTSILFIECDKKSTAYHNDNGTRDKKTFH